MVAATAESCTRRRAWLRRARRDQRGASLIEFALIVPVLMTILFGIIEFSNTYNSYNSIRQGVREGARQGVVAQFGSTSSCNLHSVSAGTSTNMQKLMCVVKNRIGLDSNSLYVNVQFDTSYAANQGLVVCAEYPLQSFTGLFAPFLNGRYLKSKVEMNIEQVSGGTETAGYEALPSGADWSWCTASNPSP